MDPSDPEDRECNKQCILTAADIDCTVGMAGIADIAGTADTASTAETANTAETVSTAETVGTANTASSAHCLHNRIRHYRNSHKSCTYISPLFLIFHKCVLL